MVYARRCRCEDRVRRSEIKSIFRVLAAAGGGASSSRRRSALDSYAAVRFSLVIPLRRRSLHVPWRKHAASCYHSLSLSLSHTHTHSLSLSLSVCLPVCLPHTLSDAHGFFGQRIEVAVLSNITTNSAAAVVVRHRQPRAEIPTHTINDRKHNDADRVG